MIHFLSGNVIVFCLRMVLNMLVLMPDSISEENLIEQSTKREIKTNAEFRAFNKLIYQLRILVCASVRRLWQS